MSTPEKNETSAPELPRPCAAIIMAAGLGTRMRSELVKVLHPVAGRPMICYPVRAALLAGATRVIVVVGHQRKQVADALEQAFPNDPVELAVQDQPLGTAHAVSCALPTLGDFVGDVLILSGDVPNLQVSLLTNLLAMPMALRFVSMLPADAGEYGRVVRDATTSLPLRIVEFRDATPEERQLREVNAGLYCIDSTLLTETLKTLGRDNAQGEYYLTDLVARASGKRMQVGTIPLKGDAAHDVLGVNDRLELSMAETRMQGTLRRALMRSGVTMLCPERTYLHDGVMVGPDTVLEPDVSLLGATRIGAACRIDQGSRLTDTVVGDAVSVFAYSHIDATVIETGCQVGPFARLREGTILRENAKVGNFVETKKTELGEGAKASHLSYLGDATIGARANIGAGTITCNYDGTNKHRTVIGAGAFIGSDTQLVAPVEVGEGAYVGAGTTVCEDVPPGALAITRAPRRTIEGWVKRKR